MYITVAKELKRKNRLPKQPEMKGKSFYSIIEDFKTQTSEGGEQSEERTSINELISGTPQYEGSYSQVTGSSMSLKRNRYSGRKGKLITFTEFMKKNL